MLDHGNGAFPSRCDGAWQLDGVRQARAVRAGALHVASGTVWLTRSGELDDHVLSAGASLRLAPGQRVWVQPWTEGERARLCWRVDQPPPRGARWRLPAARVLRGLAVVFVAAGARLADWARTAEARARRAQGCIAAGESIASSGALQ